MTILKHRKDNMMYRVTNCLIFDTLNKKEIPTKPMDL